MRAIQLDVTDRAACAKAADAIGTVHILCPNAGVFMGGPTQDASFDDWDFVLGINLGGVVNIVKTFMPRMVAQGEGGHIVLTSSINGLFASGGAGVYTASKFAVTGLGECLRMNLAEHGIGVSILCPGAIATGLFDSTPAVRPKELSDIGAHLVALDETDPVSQEIFAGAMSSEEVGRKVMLGHQAQRPLHHYPHRNRATRSRRGMEALLGLAAGRAGAAGAREIVGHAL